MCIPFAKSSIHEMSIKNKLRILMLITLLAAFLGVLATLLGFEAVNNAQDTALQHDQESHGLAEIKASALSTIELDPVQDDTRKILADAENKTPSKVSVAVRRARILLAGIEVMHMIAKRQMQCARGTHPSAADQFYDLAT
jgi:hypothetical protein